MEAEARKWVEEAIGLCKRATEQGAVLMIRSDSDNNEGLPPMVITNAATADMVGKLGEALQGGYAESDE